MLDIKFIKTNTQEVLSRLRIRNLDGTLIVKQVIAADDERISLQQREEYLITFQKETSSLLLTYIKLKNEEIIDMLKVSLHVTKNEIQRVRKAISIRKDIIFSLLLKIPNIPHISVPSFYNKLTISEIN